MRHQTDWQFKPPLWAWLLTLFTVLAFSSLSHWQWQRAGEKEVLLELFASDAERRDVRSLDELEGLPLYAPVTLHGELLDDRQFLLENMMRDGQSGFHVWTPLALADDGGLIIVDRGWVAEETAGETPAGRQAVHGRLASLPRPGFRLTAPAPEGEWPRRIYFPEVGDLEAQLGAPVHDGRLLLAPDADQPGYRRDWAPINMPPERHLGYAFQWAALALAVLIVFLVVNLKRVNRNERD
ncbi:SURF1 family protein [Natronospira bacteriovora]|uniref:SURF1-like protein n=1 Tax=Natronospira bacteriovora TaxID=3069753 RepID=A0ABU0W802_9GAMM|nr:SURF1 family protein [Natronospira sp. AB-CW4]MDQ2070166.1 SURF1 family protein [Natronospira sp. AB-CW4]